MIFRSLLATFAICTCIASTPYEKTADQEWVSMDQRAGAWVLQNYPQKSELIKESNGIQLLKIDGDLIDEIAHVFHKNKNYGGFIHHETWIEGRNALRRSPLMDWHHKNLRTDFTITSPGLVSEMIPKLTESGIRSVIEKLSSFFTRYYTTKTGQEASEWVMSEWKRLSVGRDDITVSFFPHTTGHPSVILRVEGKSQPQETVVLGGHLDSTAGWGGATKRAPGADDNASGVAVMTELIRILGDTGYKPEKSIEFIAFAAEEVGLRGSKAIAAKYKADNRIIPGMLNLDMVNYHGSDVDVVLTDDFVNPAMNQFLKDLNNRYTGLSMGTEKCGYACSDHASFYSQGYPAAFPFESYEKDMIPGYHSDKDTLEACGGTADHALKFAKLALAWMIELAK